MVLQKIEVQATFQDQISAGIQQALDKMEELQISTASVAQAYERLNKAQGLYTQGANAASAATATLQAQSQNLGTTIQKTRTHLFQMSLQSKQTAASLRKAKIEETFSDEVSARIQNALDTMVEFGASVEDLERATRRLNKTQKDGLRGTAQQANALRTLVDESENAEFAIRNMEKATKIATQTGLKLEDAGRQLGMAFRGDATILRNFDQIARQAADSIEKMNNPAQRQAAIMRELAKAQRRVSGNFGKFQNSIARADVTLNKVGLSVGRLATGFAGLAFGAIAAGFKLITDAVSAYNEASQEAIAITQQYNLSKQQLLETEGELISKTFALGEAETFLGELYDERTQQLMNQETHLSAISLEYSKLQDELFGFHKETRLGGRDILTYAEQIQLLIATMHEATRETARMETKLHNDRIQRARELDRFMSTLEKDDDAARRRLEQELESARKLGSKVSTAPGITPLVRATIMQEQQEAFAKKFGPDFAGPEAPAPTKPKPKKRRGRGGRARQKAETFIGGQSIEEIEQGLRDYERAVAEERRLGQERAAQALFLQSELEGATAGFDGISTKLREQIELTRQQIELNRKLAAGYREVSTQVQQFTRGSLAMAIDASKQLFEGLTAGEFSLANFGRNLLNTTADLVGQMGQAFILMGSGIESIKTGILSPGALIAIGVGMVALSGAMKGFAAQGDRTAAGGGAGAGGGTAAALERFGRRIFERGDADQGREVTINIEGRSMRGFVLDVAADGARRGSVPLTPRRV